MYTILILIGNTKIFIENCNQKYSETTSYRFMVYYQVKMIKH